MNYDWSMTMVVDPPDHGRALAGAVHHKQPIEQLRDKDLAAQ